MDDLTLTVTRNGEAFPNYRVEENLLLTEEPMEEGDTLVASYRVKNSYTILPATDSANACVIHLHPEVALTRAKIRYECSLEENYNRLETSINPLHRTEKQGFIYLTDKEEPIRTIEIISEDRYSSSSDEVRVFAVLKDQYGNPCEDKEVSFSISGTATLLVNQISTDDNGVAIATVRNILSAEETVTVQCEGVTASKTIRLE